jgi:tetratricopeptide (TPR) repeat protein
MHQDPSAFDALIQEGLAASQADRTDDALALFHQAAEHTPASGLPHFLIGAELAQLGRMDEAEAAYANAVLLAPDLLMARYQLGLIQFTSARAALALVTCGAGVRSCITTFLRVVCTLTSALDPIGSSSRERSPTWPVPFVFNLPAPCIT